MRRASVRPSKGEAGGCARPRRHLCPCRSRCLRATLFIKDRFKDIQAVRAAIVSSWSNGQTEGQITKLKLVKRQMYGRGKLIFFKPA
ncbi:hypothetical protein GFM09_06290 [Rhizobium leguminosarum bv. viciae]|uniref:Transposase IS204/IS1001/IS1096/IS1165 DDE domain-containing protein n=1 Tax=Rhizobium leguminosarum TaxID=384 RepID=A0A6P0DEU1_RHILE|nr:hypothetical protein [Rhizobium leguminosarum]NKJ81103.1 hypothetical protein [Rhizobium leguminosarum bv. viciae]PUB64643.1 hypothetical protein DB728_11695 [Rhizobium leguminosarum bv. viciae USDA 2370]NEK50086.1 hypothetical protein [Rhizobium leguminosarum]NKK12513.1 hypothetical protein [Rhizobium leguminosarum bv. viciae]